VANQKAFFALSWKLFSELQRASAEETACNGKFHPILEAQNKQISTKKVERLLLVDA
jgi:hypothetical protein